MNFRNLNVHFRTYLSWFVSVMPCGLLSEEGFEICFSGCDHLPLAGDCPDRSTKPGDNEDNGGVIQKSINRLEGIIDDSLGICVAEGFDEIAEWDSVENERDSTGQCQSCSDDHEGHIDSICKSEEAGEAGGLDLVLHGLVRLILLIVVVDLGF